MRSGSSLKEFSGVFGVRRTLFAKSISPPYGSMNSGVAPVNSSAIELTVKSRRDKSPSIDVPNSTSGFLESLEYVSLRYVVISTVVSPRFAATVPNSIPVSQTLSAHFCNIFLLSRAGALVVKSRSLPSLPRSASRTGPPTSARVKPFSLKTVARELAKGAR